MLIDGLTLTPTSTADNFRIKAGPTFPSSPADGQVYRLTGIDGTYQPGIYYYDAAQSTWVAFDSRAIKGTSSAIATLDAQGKIPSHEIPAVALTDTFVVATQAAMLGLGAQTGDVAIRTDENKTYILQGADPSNIDHWVELLGSSSSNSYDIATQVVGKPDAGEVILRFVAVRPFTLSPNLAGSYLKSSVAAAVPATFSIKKNGTTFCTATIAASGTAATFGSCAQQSFTAGDLLTIEAPAVQDPSMADLALCLLGTSA